MCWNLNSLTFSHLCARCAVSKEYGMHAKKYAVIIRFHLISFVFHPLLLFASFKFSFCLFIFLLVVAMLLQIRGIASFGTFETLEVYTETTYWIFPSIQELVFSNHFELTQFFGSSISFLMLEQSDAMEKNCIQTRFLYYFSIFSSFLRFPLLYKIHILLVAIFAAKRWKLKRKTYYATTWDYVRHCEVRWSEVEQSESSSSIQWNDEKWKCERAFCYLYLCTHHTTAIIITTLWQRKQQQQQL